MFIDVRSQKAFSAPAGRHMSAQMSLLTELASFSLPELYTSRAAGASQMPNPQTPVRSEILNSFLHFVVDPQCLSCIFHLHNNEGQVVVLRRARAPGVCSPDDFIADFIYRQSPGRRQSRPDPLLAELFSFHIQRLR
jgi:hypothetical protein